MGYRSGQLFVCAAFVAVMEMALGTGGAAASPIIINTVQDLANINTDLSGDYVLGQDIDASTIGNFAPIGTSTPFVGTLDGNGHTISSLSISSSASNVGLFGALGFGAVVKNLTLKNGSVIGSSFSQAVGGLAGSNSGTISNVSSTINVFSTGGGEVGGLVGLNVGFGTVGVNGVIRNSTSSGTVSGSDSTVGGLVGMNSVGTIDGSGATGSVSCSECWAGGLVGYNQRGPIAKSFATGNVSTSGTSFQLAGGLVGYNLSNSGIPSTIDQSYAVGNVTGSYGYFGGLIGRNYSILRSPSTIVSNSYALGAVVVTGSSTESAAGGLIGDTSDNTFTSVPVDSSYASGSISVLGGASAGGLIGLYDGGGHSTITNSYWDSITTGQSSSAVGGTALTTKQLQSGKLPSGFDKTVWVATSGQYPSLLWQTPSPMLPPVTAVSPVNFGFPLKNTINSYHLVTEIGGESSSTSPPPAYSDPLHTGGGYYSLDLGSDISGEVVAARDGVVVYVDPVRSKANDGPVIVIYNGSGYFTEYREFTAPSVSLGDTVISGEQIGTYITGATGYDGKRALHFQVKYNDALSSVPATSYASYRAAEATFLAANSVPGVTSAWDKDLQLSACTIKQLASVTLAGGLLDQYQLIDGPGIVRYSEALPLHGSQTPLSLAAFGTTDATIAGGTADLVEHSPAYIWATITVPPDAQFLTFDYFWSNKGDGDYLSLYFDDKLLADLLGLDFTNPDFLTIGPISISEFGGQTGQLLFYLNSVGEPNAKVAIRDVAFLSNVSTGHASVPEPSSLLMFGCGLLIFAGISVRLTERFRPNYSAPGLSADV